MKVRDGRGDGMTIRFGGTDEAPLLADLYLPNVDGPRPLVVAATGGGWVRGHRRTLAQWGAYLSARGFAMASIDYRRATHGPAYPGNAEDVAAALNHFAREGQAYKVDPQRLVLLGVSAGAHLAALVALSDRFTAPAPRGLIAVSGVYDLMVQWQHDLALNSPPGEDKIERMIGCTPFNDPQVYHDASPLRQITYAKAMPVMLAWGHLDRDIPPDQSVRFAQALRQARFPVRTFEFPDAAHHWLAEQEFTDVGSHCARLAPDLLRFLKTHIEGDA